VKKDGGMVQGAYVSPGHTQLAELAQQQANDIAFDPSAISILDEAVTLGVLPAIKYVFCVPAATWQATNLLLCISFLCICCNSASSSSSCLLWVIFSFVLPAGLCSSSSSVFYPSPVDLLILFVFFCLLCTSSSSFTSS